MATGSLCHLQGWENSRKSLDTGLKAQRRSPAELEIRAQGEGVAKLLPSGCCQGLGKGQVSRRNQKQTGLKLFSLPLGHLLVEANRQPDRRGGSVEIPVWLSSEFLCLSASQSQSKPFYMYLDFHQ